MLNVECVSRSFSREKLMSSAYTFMAKSQRQLAGGRVAESPRKAGTWASSFAAASKECLIYAPHMSPCHRISRYIYIQYICSYRYHTHPCVCLDSGSSLLRFIGHVFWCPRTRAGPKNLIKLPLRAAPLRVLLFVIAASWPPLLLLAICIQFCWLAGKLP